MSTYLPPGTPVRVLRPDLPAHADGVVHERRLTNDWSVLVAHRCDCWHPGHIETHVRGYQFDELSVATL